jgi:hypothetical protein
MDLFDDTFPKLQIIFILHISNKIADGHPTLKVRACKGHQLLF